MLQRINETDFPEIYRIMQASFSDDEYRPYDEQLALFEDPEYRIYYMPAGFLAVWEFESFIYIEHFSNFSISDISVMFLPYLKCFISPWISLSWHIT